MQLANRHPSTQHLGRFFAYSHLPEHLQAPAQVIHDAAADLLALVPDGPELTTGLRKLLEAKDCMVRALL
ncbi:MULTISPECIES: hypothetical protein [unclassified Crossiella]|uniref:hypothetical protein n=1 Tax=unclassified Crossiella TaxID=2620835 RepID=UPI001FFF507C|nr:MULTISPECIES: hypothetical protein [unclassified Crossiella]MCK2242158.1 hypothetical protein [Crossiella sp. S99.2]MCK2256061.1 hypothetical protein [Crossiella sp. S99.1]